MSLIIKSLQCTMFLEAERPLSILQLPRVSIFKKHCNLIRYNNVGAFTAYLLKKMNISRGIHFIVIIKKPNFNRALPSLWPFQSSSSSFSSSRLPKTFCCNSFHLFPCWRECLWILCLLSLSVLLLKVLPKTLDVDEQEGVILLFNATSPGIPFLMPSKTPIWSNPSAFCDDSFVVFEMMVWLSIFDSLIINGGLGGNWSPPFWYN